MTSKEILSRNLRFIRYSMDIPTKVAAEIIGIHENQYLWVEEGQRSPNLRMLSRIADGFKLQVHQLLERRDDFIFDNLPCRVKVRLRKRNKRVMKQLEPINE